MKTIIHLETQIYAPLERCFDLARSIDLHIVSTEGSNEKAVGGRTKGLILEGETVTWRATHFFVRQTLTTKIVSMQRPHRFYDVMKRGAFRSMEHEHIFRQQNGVTIMIDEFVYEPPFKILGELFNKLVLRRYMTRLLEARNSTIKKVAESDLWKKFL